MSPPRGATESAGPAFPPGALVRARGREWVVLPDSEPDLLLLRPLGGSDEEIAGILTALEPVEPATFQPPDPAEPGDERSGRLLRDAVRLSFRSASGPFRSFARIAVEPRPYQLVPLLVSLRQDPVRVLVADDVGIGKTIEAALIARELLDRGEAKRLAVLCPPHLAEQWQQELRDKFHLDAELVLASTAARLERGCALNESLFDRYPYVIVSIDFIKSERRRMEFLQRCPELVIVDEAHSCADPGSQRSTQQQRYRLLRDLAGDAERHLILVTATPHSGNEAAFRSLLGLLDPALAELPSDLTGDANRRHREHLARFFVQRRRADIRRFLEAETPFPDRLDGERTYEMTPPYRKLLDDALAFARESVSEAGEDKRRQRIRWWSALALLRAIGSSPMAAAATLRTRARVAASENAEQADELGARSVMDAGTDDPEEMDDALAGADFGEEDEGETAVPGPEADSQTRRYRRRMLEMARRAEALAGEEDAKLAGIVRIVRDLLNKGHQPILFCRFIPTAEYVGAALRDALPKTVTVEVVTGTLPPTEREARVSALGDAAKRVLVATDCLSEGINLQDAFDAVVHYDLSWNPTRHEQREGRVDRFGQPKPQIRVVTYYGANNPVDGLVLDVLLRKHKEIRKSLGVSVPVPADSQDVLAAIMEGLTLRGKELQLDLFDTELKRRHKGLDDEWTRAADQEKRSRTLFAQETIKTEEVATELAAAQAAVGAGVELRGFVEAALRAFGAQVAPGDDALRVNVAETPRALRDALGLDGRATEQALRFALPVQPGEIYLTRTHPLVAALASHVLDTALDGGDAAPARRCGVVMTRGVTRSTTLLVVRFRDHLVLREADGEETLLAEDCRLLAFEGSPADATWLLAERAEALLSVRPDANIGPDQATLALRKLIDGLPELAPALEDAARQHADELLAAHRRVRSRRPAIGGTGRRGEALRAEPNLPPDVIGVYLYRPVQP